jgi:transcription termination factor NusB
MIDKKTKSRVQYSKTCVDCNGRVVKNEDIIKGFQYEKGKYVFFYETYFEKLKSQKDKTVAIEKFVNLAEIDPIYFEKAYYVSPQKGAEKAFALLLSAMQKEKKVGIAKTIIGTKENLVALRTYGDNLILNTLYFDDEVRQAPAAPNQQPDAKEMEMAKSKANDQGLASLCERIVELHKQAIITYTPYANDIIGGYITDEKEIDQILSKMLDHCGHDEMLKLFKAVLRAIICKHPKLVHDYVYIYKDFYDSDLK